MANINAELSIVDSNGDVTTLYPKTYASNVLMANGDTVEIAVNDKADSSHTHDERYYTENEIDNLLSNISGGGNPGNIPINPTAEEKANLTMWIEV